MPNQSWALNGFPNFSDFRDWYIPPKKFCIKKNRQKDEAKIQSRYVINSLHRKTCFVWESLTHLYQNSPILLFNLRLISNKQQVYHYETLHNALALKYSKHTIHTRRSHEDINVIKKRSWDRSRSWCSGKKHWGKSTSEWAHFQLLRLVGFCPHIWNSPVKFSQGQQEENRTLLILHTSLPTSYDFWFSLRLKGFTSLNKDNPALHIK